jgi:hypothetical protein
VHSGVGKGKGPDFVTSLRIDELTLFQFREICTDGMYHKRFQPC